jgi:DNA-binding ferritin-like protein
MSASLYELNENLCAHLNVAFDCATAIDEQGIANFLADRIDAHKKNIWQLGTIIGADSMTISSME